MTGTEPLHVVGVGAGGADRQLRRAGPPGDDPVRDLRRDGAPAGAAPARATGPRAPRTVACWRAEGATSTARTFWHGGLGSSVCWGDPDPGLAMAFLTDGVRRDEAGAVARRDLSDAVRAAGR